MNKHIKYKHFILIIFIINLLTFTRCATVVAPTGGEKDTIPPIAIRFNPTQGQTNFKEKTIYLEFNEDVVQNGLTKELLITPRTDNKYENQIVKNRVKLIFDEDFEKNTTYNFNFREGIKDVTEGNKAQNLNLYFSTGPNLDTGGVMGKVTEILTDKIIKTSKVGLYIADDTTDIFNKEPRYFASVNEKDGFYFVRNVKPGNYRIFAFEDENNNDITDPTKEAYAFRNEILDVTNNIDTIDLKLVKVDINPFQLEDGRANGRYFDIKSNKTMMTIDVSTEPQQNLNYNLIEKGRVIRFYNIKRSTDSTLVKIQAIDTIGQPLEKEVYIKFPPTRRNKEALEWSIKELTYDPATKNYGGSITFNKPISNINMDSIFIEKDTVTYINLDFKNYSKWNQFRDELTFSIPFDTLITPIKEYDTLLEEYFPIDKVILKFQPMSFLSVESDTSKVQTKEINLVNKEEINEGILRGSVNISEKNYIIELLDKDFKIIDSIRNEVDYEFTELKTQEYRIRVRVVKDEKSEWDYGNYLDKREPGKVYHYPEPIKMRSTWVVEEINIPYSLVDKSVDKEE